MSSRHDEHSGEEEPNPGHLAEHPSESEDDEPTIHYPMTTEQRVWVINQYYWPKYLDAKKTRGSKEKVTGKSFSYGLYKDYLDHFHPDWPPKDRKKYKKVVGHLIYTSFNNKYKHDKPAHEYVANLQEEKGLQSLTKARSSKPKSSSSKTSKRVTAAHEWGKKNPEKVKPAVQQYMAANSSAIPGAPSVRHVVCKLWNDLEPPEQSRWESEAVQMREAQRLMGPLKGQDLIEYGRTWVDALNSLVKEGRAKTGMSFAAFFCWDGANELGEPIHQMQDYVSRDIKEFRDSEQFVDAHAGFFQWCRDYKGINIKGQDPVCTVLPDPQGSFRPKFPDPDGKILSDGLRNLNRQFLNAEYSFTGGVGSVPWTALNEIYLKGEINLWIPNWPPNLPFDDPHSLSKPQNVELSLLLRKVQDGASREESFWFSRVVAGQKTPSSAPPKLCSATHYTVLERHEKEYYVFHFDKPVTEPQSERPVSYPPCCWEYYHHVFGEKTLEHWMGLKSVASDSAVVLFKPRAFELVRSTLGLVNETYCTKLIEGFEVVNAIQQHGPFLVRRFRQYVQAHAHVYARQTEKGIWGLDDAQSPLPVLLPSSKPRDVAEYIVLFLTEWWVSDSYALSSYTARSRGFGENSTLDFCYSWAESLLDSSFFHKPSNTLQGADGGYVWVIAAFAKLMLSASVPVLKVVPPTPPPSSLKLDRLARQWDMLVDTYDQWVARGRASLAILSKTSHERVHAAQLDDATSSHGNVDSSIGDFDTVPASVELPKESEPISADKGKGKGKPPAAMSKTSKGANKAARPSEVERPAADTGGNSGYVLDAAHFEPGPLCDDTSNRKNYFGPFAVQKDYPPHPGTPQDVLIDAQTTVHQMDAKVQAWLRFDKLYSASYPVPAIKYAVSTLLTPIVAGGRKLSQILKAIDDILAPADAPPAGPVKKKLREMRLAVCKGILACRMIFEPAQHMESLTTIYANILQDGWNADICRMGVGETMELAHRLGEWRTQGSGAARDIFNCGVARWRDYSLPAARMPPTGNFRFGCPKESIFDAEAHTLMLKNPAGRRYSSPEPQTTQLDPLSTDTPLALSGMEVGLDPATVATDATATAEPDATATATTETDETAATDATAAADVTVAAEVSSPKPTDQLVLTAVTNTLPNPPETNTAPDDPMTADDTEAAPTTPAPGRSESTGDASAGLPEQPTGSNAVGNVENDDATAPGDNEVTTPDEEGQGRNGEPAPMEKSAARGRGARGGKGDKGRRSKGRGGGGAARGTKRKAASGAHDSADAGDGLEDDDLDVIRMQARSATSGAGGSGTTNANNDGSAASDAGVSKRRRSSRFKAD
ncbi:hypothetical protein FRC07_006518 [Ceratobasidium sp. 392]|nr:hypothetical protein FRC07_006518 [Ceratobasidium sp. 392]